jgi:hypothetical protein
MYIKICLVILYIIINILNKINNQTQCKKVNDDNNLNSEGLCGPLTFYSMFDHSVIFKILLDEFYFLQNYKLYFKFSLIIKINHKDE